MINCVLATMLLPSCIKDDYAGPAPDLPSRTVLIYMAADNSLSEEVARKVEALRQGWTWTGNKCLVYADTPSGARLLRLRGGCRVTPEPYVETVREYGAENSASAEVFGRVLREVVTEWPADSYGLVFFSHGSGWLPAGSLRKPAHVGSRSLGWDGGTVANPATGRAGMELAEFAAAIPDGQFDFIVFEACLMAGVEVAYELRHKTDYLLVSSAEIVSPGFTPVYPSALRCLFATSRDAQECLAAFGEAYMNHVNKLSGDYRSATLSLVATQELDLLAARTRELLADGSPRADIAFGLQHFDRPGSYGDSPAVARYFDLGEWAERTGCPEQYAAFEAQLKRIVRWKANTGYFLPSYNGFEIHRHSGLTTYVERSELPSLNEYYGSTAWGRAVFADLQCDLSMQPDYSGCRPYVEHDPR